MDKLKVWLYWDKEDKKSDFIRLCYDTIYKYCVNFEIVETNDNSIDYYLPNIVFPEFKVIQHRADFIRVNLLKAYGGVWLDSDTIVLRDPSIIYKILENHDIFATAWIEDGKVRIANGILACKKNSMLMNIYNELMNKIIQLKGAANLGWSDIGANILDFLHSEFRDDFALLDQSYSAPLHHKEYDMFFKDVDIDKFYNENMLFVNGYNYFFPDKFKQLSKEQILSGSALISQFFRKALFNE